MQGLATAAEWFIGLFQQGGSTFMGLVTGIIPTLVVLMTFVNALIAIIGPEKIEKLGEVAGRDGIIYYPLRYIILPFLSVFFLTNPMAYTMGRFLPRNSNQLFMMPQFLSCILRWVFSRISTRVKSSFGLVLLLVSPH